MQERGTFETWQSEEFRFKPDGSVTYHEFEKLREVKYLFYFMSCSYQSTFLIDHTVRQCTKCK